MSTSRAKAKELLKVARSKANLNQPEVETNLTSNNMIIVPDSQRVEEKILNQITDLNITNSNEDQSSIEKEIIKIEQKHFNNFKLLNKDCHTNLLNNHVNNLELNQKGSNNVQSKNINKQNMFIKPQEKGPMKLIGMEANPIQIKNKVDPTITGNTSDQSDIINNFEIPKTEDKEKLLKRISSAKQRSQKRFEKQKEMQTKKSDKIIALAKLMEDKQSNPDNEENDKKISNLIENWNPIEVVPKKKFLLDNDSDMQLVDDGDNV